ncbi:hypothetical protein AAHA92_33988 [Salvia divinorum]|uniref:Uncharacterized protein n=1 Tax=Salvia divinorum TaxID=28513 RepID=A0ABD1FHK0_SALDI
MIKKPLETLTHLMLKAVEPGPSADAHRQSPNEEDVSFSDLEDEENDDPSDKVSARRASTSEKAWVQLDENSGSQCSKQNASHNVSKDKDSEGMPIGPIRSGCRAIRGGLLGL